jgi:hypothetical protein
MLALISLYAPVVIIILAVVAVLFSFFWVFLPLPRWMSNAMGRLLIRFWRWRERREGGRARNSRAWNVPNPIRFLSKPLIRQSARTRGTFSFSGPLLPAW